jgi:hypothetical protein
LKRGREALARASSPTRKIFSYFCA